MENMQRISGYNESKKQFFPIIRQTHWDTSGFGQEMFFFFFLSGSPLKMSTLTLIPISFGSKIHWNKSR